MFGVEKFNYIVLVELKVYSFKYSWETIIPPLSFLQKQTFSHWRNITLLVKVNILPLVNQLKHQQTDQPTNQPNNQTTKQPTSTEDKDRPSKWRQSCLHYSFADVEDNRSSQHQEQPEHQEQEQEQAQEQDKDNNKFTFII